MRPDKQTMALMGVVEELKRRKIFVSMVMTRTNTQISWWDRGAGRVREGSMDEAALFIGALETNDRLEVERIGRGMKGRRAYA